MENKTEELLKDLQRILINFKKSPSRKYLKETLKQKEAEAKSIYETILQQIESLENHEYLVTEARRLFSEIKLFITTRLATASDHVLKFKTLSKIFIALINLHNKTKMTAPKVDLKMGTSIVQVYDGNQEGLSSFIDSVMLFSDTVTAEFSAATPAQQNTAKTTVIRFIKTRLTGKARAAIDENVVDINEIVNKLKLRCGVTPSPDVFVSKLNQTKQIGDINKFANEIENLVLHLEKAYISENIPVEVAVKMATKQGVKALALGVRSSETKILLKAGQFSTLSAAIEKAIENEIAVTSSTNQNAQVMFTARRGQSQQNRGYSNNTYRQRGHNFSGNRGGFSNRRGRGNFQNFQSNNHAQNNQFNRGRGSHRGFYRGAMQSRIFYTNSTEHGQLMCPHQQQSFQNGQQNAQPYQNQQAQSQPQRIQHQESGQQNFLGPLFSQ